MVLVSILEYHFLITKACEALIFLGTNMQCPQVLFLSFAEIIVGSV